MREKRGPKPSCKKRKGKEGGEEVAEMVGGEKSKGKETRR